MTHLASEFNPFMLMVNPEIVLAAIEKSERLSQLSSQMCRPLDKVPGQAASNADDGGDDNEGDELSA